jgi:hypothetical protein
MTLNTKLIDKDDLMKNMPEQNLKAREDDPEEIVVRADTNPAGIKVSHKSLGLQKMKSQRIENIKSQKKEKDEAQDLDEEAEIKK